MPPTVPFNAEFAVLEGGDVSTDWVGRVRSPNTRRRLATLCL